MLVLYTALQCSAPVNQIAGGPTIRYNGTGDVPGYDRTSPVPDPITPVTDQTTLISLFYTELQAVNNNKTTFQDSCSQCLASTQILHLAALTLSVASWTDLNIQYCMFSTSPVKLRLTKPRQSRRRVHLRRQLPCRVQPNTTECLGIQLRRRWRGPLLRTAVLQDEHCNR